MYSGSLVLLELTPFCLWKISLISGEDISADDVTTFCLHFVFTFFFSTWPHLSLHVKSIFPRALLQPQPQNPQLVFYQYQRYWFH